MEDRSLGQIVHSRAGRDKGRYFVVVSIVDDEFVMIADGDLHKMDNPKLKRRKHLVFHDKISSEVQTALKVGTPIIDAMLRKSLQSMGLL